MVQANAVEQAQERVTCMEILVQCITASLSTYACARERDTWPRTTNNPATWHTSASDGFDYRLDWGSPPTSGQETQADGIVQSVTANPPSV